MGTTSAGVAYSRGYPEGQRMGRAEMIGEISRIISAVKIPVTADTEAGYGAASDDAARSVRGAIEAGVVGGNLEDDTLGLISCTSFNSR